MTGGEKKHHKPVDTRSHGRREKDTRPGPAPEKKAASGHELTEISAELHEEIVRKRDEYLESLKRLQAEFDNYRKRMLKGNDQSASRASAEVIEDILPVLDNFERAMRAAIEHDEKVLGGGVELVYNQLKDILSKRGLCEIEAEGSPFDPSRHEAVLCRPSSEHDEGTVMEVLEKGYEFQDRILRPAKVIVSSGNEEGRKKEERETAGPGIQKD